MEMLPLNKMLLGMTFFEASGANIRSISKEVKFENYPIEGEMGEYVSATYDRNKEDPI